jgi:DNA polymerase I-like protein with 3'-5' exonuclease and polymerase domains
MPKKLSGRHGLETWGYRLGEHKGDYNDWSKFTEEMLIYNVQDVVVTTKLYKLLMKGKTPLEALQLEQDVQRIITQQHINGWKFDIKKAQELHVILLANMEPLAKEVHEIFLPKFLPKTGGVKIPKKPFRRNGVWTMGPHQPIELRAFNPNSSQHIARWLINDFGWEPYEFTDKGAPKTGAEYIRHIPHAGIVPLLKWLDNNKLLTMLADGDNAWLRKVTPKGRIHGSVDILGANTGRFTHNNPNLAQVPSSTAFMGEEARSLFTVERGYTLVGADASGLELRMLSHFMAPHDGGKYGNIVVNGDIHTANQEAAGLPTRDNAKTFIYGWLYGAGDAKIGSIVNGSKAVGAKLKSEFLASTPGVADLINGIQHKVLPRSRGGQGAKYLKGISGRRLYVRSPHSALNLILQSAGAYYMKYVLVELDRRLRAQGFDYKHVGNIHDEFQMEILDAHVEEVMKVTEQTFEDVGYMMGLRIKMAGEAKAGKTWAETH